MIVAAVVSPFVWLARTLVFALLALVGLALIAWQRGDLEVRESRYFAGRRLPQFRARWMALYCNEEDGVDGLRGGDSAQSWWAAKTSAWTATRRIFVWSARRNPVDGLRFVAFLNPRIVPARVRFVGMDREPAKGEAGWYFAWQGLWSCLRWEFAVPCWLARFVKSWRSGKPVYVRVWIGWKLKPTDAQGVNASDPRAIRCDFALQLKRVA